MNAGRNDPCPCGSGKKFKKCHGAKNVVSIEAVVNEELTAIIERYLMEYPDEPRELHIFNTELNKVQRALKGFWDEDAVGFIFLEHYLFNRRKELWREYLIKQIRYVSRPAVKETIEQWMDPEFVIAEIVNLNEYSTLKNIIDGKIYHVYLSEDMDVKKGEFAIGTLLPDPRKGRDVHVVASGLSFMPGYLKPVMLEMKEMAKKEKLSSEEFFREHLMECLTRIIEDNKTERKLTPEQEEILYNLHIYLEQYDSVDETIFTVFGLYLMGTNPKPRKKEALIAAAVRFGRDYDFLPNLQTNKDLSKVFGVSTSTIQKYAEEMEDYYHLHAAKAITKDPEMKMVYEVGVYPRFSEYKNWEIHMHLKDLRPKDQQELDEKLKGIMNVPYTPKTTKERAQKYAYEAYFAENEKERNKNWTLAEANDPHNPDVRIHKAESEENARQAIDDYLKAIEESYKLYKEDIEHPWAYLPNRYFLRALFSYGIFLFDWGYYEEASERLIDLINFNMDDQQGARYPLIASLIKIERYDEAEKYFNVFANDQSAAYIYMKNTLRHKRHRDGERADAKEMFTANQYALDMLLHKKDEYTLDYPKAATIEPGSMEEAYYIYSMLADLY